MSTTDWTYQEDKVIAPPTPKRDFQTTRINQNHEKAMGAEPISHKQYGSGNPIKPKYKEFATHSHINVDTLLANVRSLWNVQQRIERISICAIQ